MVVSGEYFNAVQLSAESAKVRKQGKPGGWKGVKVQSVGNLVVTLDV